MQESQERWKMNLRQLQKIEREARPQKIDFFLAFFTQIYKFFHYIRIKYLERLSLYTYNKSSQQKWNQRVIENKDFPIFKANFSIASFASKLSKDQNNARTVEIYIAANAFLTI